MLHGTGHSSMPAKKQPGENVRQRPRLGRGLTVDETIDIPIGERRAVKRKGAFD